MLRLFFSLFFLLIFNLLQIDAQSKTDSLNNLILKASNVKKVEIYYQLAEEYYYSENSDSALEYYLKSAKESLKHIDTSYYYVKSGYGNAGFILDEQGKYDKAIEFYNLALKYAVIDNDKQEIATDYINLGTSYIKLGDYEKAANYFEMALSIDLELNNMSAISTDYNALGKLYEIWGKFDISNEYFRKALQIDIKNNDKDKIAIRLNSIGLNFKNIVQYDSAIFYITKALEIDKELGNEKKIAIRYSNLGSIYTLKKKFPEAEAFYIKAIEIFKKYNIDYSLSITLSEYAGLLYERKQFQESEVFSKKSIEIAERIKHKLILRDNYLRLSSIYEIQNKYDLAYRSFKEYSFVKDSIFNDKSLESINLLKIKFETEKIETENLKLKNEAEIKDLSLQRRKIMLIASIIIGILILILAIFFFKRMKYKTIVNQLLSEKNNQLEILNATKDKFFSIISHDLRNPLSAFNNITTAIKNNIETINKEDLQYYISELHSSSSNLYGLLQSLLLWAATQNGKMQCNPKSIKLIDKITEVISIYELNIHEKQIEIEKRIDYGLKVLADEEMLLAVLRNLISNAIKFSHMKGKIEIDSLLEGEEVLVSIKDNGIGMNPEDTENLFKINFDNKKIGNSPEKGAGLGLIISKEMIEKCGGRIFVESEQNVGSVFKFVIKKANGK